MMKRHLLIFILLLGTFYAYSQDLWKLSTCVDYAVENNISLNKAYNKISTQRINLGQSKANVLPTLNAGTDVVLGFGRSIDGNTNSVSFDQNLSNGYGINTMISLFQGLVKYNTIAFNRYMLSAVEQGAQYQKNQLIFQVMNDYFTVLYSKGLVNVAQTQVDLSYMQFSRMQKLVDVGKESPITVQDLKSQWATDKLSLVQAENNVNNTLLNLKQLLRLNANQYFEPDTLLINSLVVRPIPNVDSVYEQSLAILPEIKQQEYLLNASEKELAIVKGYVSPQIIMSAGIGTAFYNSSNVDSEYLPYGEQLKNNQNQNVRLGLNIPIFNGASTYSSIKRRQIAVIDNTLELEKKKDDLYAEIWSAVNDVQSAKNEYLAAVELDDFSQLNMQNVTKKLEKGLASTTDFEVAKQRFASAEASLLKAKLIYMMRNEMLTFYTTGNWGHL